MSGLRLDVQWEEAEQVASPELAATWARLSIFVGEECLSVVEDRLASGYRNFVDVSAYPLAEWMACNWWFLTTPHAGAKPDVPPLSAATDYRLRSFLRRHSFANAGDGFPWPNLVLLPERTRFVASQTALPVAHARVDFVRGGQFVLDFEETLYALESFVDSVVRRLEDQGVKATRLQDEWRAIHETPLAERQFCEAAAVLGVYPYDVEHGLAELIIHASEVLDHQRLLLELLSGLNVRQIDRGLEWVVAGKQRLGRHRPSAPASELIHLRGNIGASAVETPRLYASMPWLEGYARGRETRHLLDLSSRERFDVSSLVKALRVPVVGPDMLEGLARADDEAPVTVVSGNRSTQSQRFVQTRVLSRAIYDGMDGLTLVAHGNTLHDRVERAFAAEVLAPAVGVRELLEDDFSEHAKADAAKHFGVDRRVIDHQIDNQLRPSA